MDSPLRFHTEFLNINLFMFYFCSLLLFVIFWLKRLILIGRSHIELVFSALAAARVARAPQYFCPFD